MRTWTRPFEYFGSARCDSRRNDVLGPLPKREIPRLGFVDYRFSKGMYFFRLTWNDGHQQASVEFPAFTFIVFSLLLVCVFVCMFFVPVRLPVLA